MYMYSTCANELSLVLYIFKLQIRLPLLYLYVIVSANLFVQFFYEQKLIVKLGGTQLQNNSISGTQQQRGWEPLL